MITKEKILRKVISKLSDKIPGGKGDGLDDSEFDKDQLNKGIEIEMEHVSDPDLAKEIAKDHLSEIPNYYLNEEGVSRIDILEQEAEKD